MMQIKNPSTAVVTDITMEVTTETQVVGMESMTLWANINLISPTYEPTIRPNVTLAFAIDKSGSMAGSKLDMVKDTLHFVLSQLKEGDYMGLVTYDTTVNVVSELRPMNAKNTCIMKNLIDGITDGSMTNLSGGLLRAMKMLADRPISGRTEVASVLLLTDGLANHGITSTGDIIRAMQGSVLSSSKKEKVPAKEKALNVLSGLSQVLHFSNNNNNSNVDNQYIQQQQQQRPRISPAVEAVEVDDISNQLSNTDISDMSVYTFGYGADTNASLLQQIADAGHGMYYSILGNEAVGSAFADCLGGLLSVSAQNIRLDVTLHSGASLIKAHVNDVTVSSGATSFSASIGDLQSEEVKSVLLELAIPAVELETEVSGKLLSAKIDYFNVVTASNMVSSEATVSWPARVRVLPAVVEHDRDIEVHKNRVMSAISLDVARSFGDSGKLVEAEQEINRMLKLIEASAVKEDKRVAQITKDLFECKSSMASDREWSEKGKHKTTMLAQQHMKQRSNAVESVDQQDSYCAYNTSARKVMKSAFWKK